MRAVIIESPFAGDEERNRRYLAACLRDCLLRNEAPFASHAIYTLPGVLDDAIPQGRELGMEAGFEWSRRSDFVAVYYDLGISPGMEKGIARAFKNGKPVEFRTLLNWESAPEKETDNG